MSKKPTNNSIFAFIDARLNEDDEDDVVMVPPAKKNEEKPQPEKKPAARVEKKPKVDKIAQALNGIRYTYERHQRKGGRNKQLPIYFTTENWEYINVFHEKGEKYVDILNRILDEHRAFAHAGLIPEEVYYSYRTYSSKGRTQISVGVSPDNIAYIEKARNNGELAPTAACNKLIDEYRAVKKKYK